MWGWWGRVTRDDKRENLIFFEEGSRVKHFNLSRASGINEKEKKIIQFVRRRKADS